MASKPSALEHLAKVFLSGFRFGPDLTADEIRKVIDSEFLMLQRSLSQSDATEFAKLVEQHIAAMTSVDMPDSNPK